VSSNQKAWNYEYGNLFFGDLGVIWHFVTFRNGYHIWGHPLLATPIKARVSKWWWEKRQERETHAWGV